MPQRAVRHSIHTGGLSGNGIQPPRNKCIDTLAIAKRKVRGVPDYSLGTLAEHLGVAREGAHRALHDCRTAYGIYLKLKEI